MASLFFRVGFVSFRNQGVVVVVVVVVVVGAPAGVG
jgi:hypothetical protein